MAGSVLEAITLARMRASATDPGYAVDQLGNMAWTLGSTGTQDPEGALVAVRGLHSLLAQWARRARQPLRTTEGRCPWSTGTEPSRRWSAP